MKRGGYIRRKSLTKKYACRERAIDYMLAVKELPCILSKLCECEGVVEADHAGDHGYGQKSKDAEVIPMCTKHHRDRTDLTGVFRYHNSMAMREWRHAAVRTIQELMVSRGWTIPDA